MAGNDHKKCTCKQEQQMRKDSSKSTGVVALPLPGRLTSDFDLQVLAPHHMQAILLA